MIQAVQNRLQFIRHLRMLCQLLPELYSWMTVFVRHFPVVPFQQFTLNHIERIHCRQILCVILSDLFCLPIASTQAY